MTFVDLHRNVQRLAESLEEMVIDLAMEEKDFIVESNRDQLWDGKTIKKQDIRPFYSEDPWFKTKEAAERYAAWKQKITKNSKRNPDAPNLYIVGKFYKSIEAVKRGKFIETDSPISLGKDIIDKYDNIMGLNEENLSTLGQMILPKLQKNIHDELTKS